jgi:hypothetical protein
MLEYRKELLRGLCKMGGFSVAHICLNGHVESKGWDAQLKQNKPFCANCGKAIIRVCRKCEHAIQGEWVVDDWNEDNPFPHWNRPSYCQHCGGAYPWTELAIEAAQLLALELEDLSKEEREILSKTIPDLVEESPMTKVAVTRFNKVMAKVGAPTAKLFKEILSDVIKDSVKKMMFG